MSIFFLSILLTLLSLITSYTTTNPHSLYSTPSLPPPSSYESIALSYIESLFDTNNIHTIIYTLSSIGIPDVSIESTFTFYKFLLARYQYQHPQQDRLDELANQMIESLERFIKDGETIHLPPEPSHWRTYIDILMHNMKQYSHKFHDYQVLQLEPQVFGWSIQRDTYSSQSRPFMAIRASPLFESTWVKALEGSMQYMHFDKTTYLTNPKMEFLPYRNERICHVYTWFILNEVLGVLPNSFEQIIEYGGGTGDNAATQHALDFKGTHIIYDLAPMLFMQRYFLRYSGYQAFLMTPENKNTLAALARSNVTGATTILVSPSFVSTHLLPSRSDEALAKTLLLATYSLTESDMTSRRKFMESIINVGVLYITGNVNHIGYNNFEYIMNLTHTQLRNYECAFIPGNFPNEFTFIAIRNDLNLSFDQHGKFQKEYELETGRCVVLKMNEAHL